MLHEKFFYGATTSLGDEVVNKLLFRYEENYFNCRNAQFVSHLRTKGVPVDYYFYNCFENTKTIYDHLFTQNKNRWLFDTNCISKNQDFNLLGVNVVEKKYTRFQSAKEHIAQLVKEDLSIFIWLCNYYIPHREHYQQYRSFHSFIFDDLIEGEEPHYVVQDPPKFRGEISEAIIKKAFTATPGMIRGITYLDYAFIEVDTKNLMNKYKEWLNSFTDDFSTYMIVQKLIPNHLIKDVEKFMYFFAILFGSRLLFSRFLEVMSFDQALVNEAAECSGISESIHSMLLNYYEKKEEVDIEWIISQITVLVEKEKALISALKKADLASDHLL